MIHRHLPRFAYVLAVASLVLCSCQAGTATTAPTGGVRSAATQPSQLQAFSATAKVSRGAVADVVKIAGQVQALSEKELTLGTMGGRIVEVLVRTGQQVELGQVLLRLNPADLQRRVRETEADQKVAEAVLSSARQSSGEVELAKAEAALTQAQSQWISAHTTLTVTAQLGLASLENAVADAQLARQLAQDKRRQQEINANQTSIRKLEYDQGFLQRTLRDLPANDPRRVETERSLATSERDLLRARSFREDTLRQAQLEVDKAQKELGSAQELLSAARSGQDDPLASARLAVQQAQTNLDAAKKRRDDLRAGGQSATVQSAKTSYDAATARVEQAKADLAATTVRAPFAGVVLTVYVKPGDRVLASDKLVFVADMQTLRVKATATEVDVPRLAIGQAVRITFDALPGPVFSGQILALPVRGQSSGGLSSYEVQTSLVRNAAEIRLDLWANVSVVVGEKQDVLTVPAAAVTARGTGQGTVKVRGDEGTDRDVNIGVGLNDGLYVEVLSGLEEGQTIVIPLQSPSSLYGMRVPGMY